MAMPVNSIYTAVHGSSSLELGVFTVGLGVPGFTGGLGFVAGACTKCTVGGGGGVVLAGVSGSTCTVGGGRGVVTPGLVPSSPDSEELESPLGAPTFAIGFSATISKGGSSSSLSWSLADDFVQQVPIYNLCVC